MPDTLKALAVASRLVVSELRRRGLDAEMALNEAGIDPESIVAENARVSFFKEAALLEIGAAQSRDDTFALAIAARLDPRDLGSLGYIGLSSSTLGDALLNLERYLGTIVEDFRIKLEIDDGVATVAFNPTDPVILKYRQAVECSIGSLVRYYRFVIDRPVDPVEVRFVHDYAGSPDGHRAYFGCPVLFGQKRCEVRFDRKDLAARISTADDRLLKILRSHCDTLLKQRARKVPDNRVKLERCIVDLLPKGEAKAKVVAAELGMSERSLIRHLADTGTSFSEVLDQLRRDLALKYLRRRDLNLAQVAFLLGYSSQSAFSAAFKRMTGLSPREVRNAN